MIEIKTILEKYGWKKEKVKITYSSSSYYGSSGICYSKGKYRYFIKSKELKANSTTLVKLTTSVLSLSRLDEQNGIIIVDDIVAIKL
jgi:hypothetical protein